MIPGTTPTFIIMLKNAQDYLINTQHIRIDIRQQDILLTKEDQDIIIDTENNLLGITLTQKESLKFLYKKGNLEFQVHGLLKDGKTAWKTYVVDTPVDRTLSNKVIFKKIND